MKHNALRTAAQAILTIVAGIAFCFLFAEGSTPAAQLAVWACSGLTLYLAYKGLDKLGTFNS
jgi:hypothetical protein